MTFNYVAAKNLIFSKSIIKKINPKAIDIGSQTPSIDKVFIKKLFDKNASIKNFNINEKYFKKIMDSKNFSVEDFFKAAGFYDYQSIDINGSYNSHKFDLNLDIRETYKFAEEFDLVINNGTGEHVFNQYSLFKNIHNLTNMGGLMTHILPFYNWINHGFYNYHPIFFGDIAASKQYEILKMTVANRNGNEISVDIRKHIKFYYEQIKPGRQSELRKFLNTCLKNLGDNLLLIVVFKKNNPKKFNTPLQGKYLFDLYNNSDYRHQTEGSGDSIGQINDNNKRK